VDPDQPPQPGERRFTALVRRLDCAGGETGEVLEPEVHEGGDRVTVTFSVGGLAYGPCVVNKAVPYAIELASPLADRVLVDGVCESDRFRSTAVCMSSQRWPAERSIY
jgi:hypothetical protein